MTALSEYQRLEAPGVWRAGGEAQRRDVIVSLGDATLTISDMAERALTHWSLAAIERRGGGDAPALYAPGVETDEELEIEDETMVAAIERVRRAVQRRRPKKGRVRLVVAALMLAAIAAGAVFWLPGALKRNAVAVVPESQRLDIGARLLSELERFTGPPCSSRLGDRALSALQDRLRGGREGRIVVVPETVDSALHLPGGIIVLGREMLQAHDNPDVLAGFILSEDLRAAARDPLARLLDDAGPWNALQLLTTGDVPQPALAAHATTLVGAAPAPIAPEALNAEFNAAGLPSLPYANALGDTAYAEALRSGNPGRDPNMGPVLRDENWISLQAICLR